MIDEPGWLVVKNWRQFQHYRNRRNTLWLKLYKSLLNDYAFIRLTPSDRWRLLGLWLLALDSDGRVPEDQEYLRRKLSDDGLELAVLVAAGWLIRESELKRPKGGRSPPV